jgi:hypothetical protein
MTRQELTEILNHIFANILPEYGYAVRENQIGLAEHILETISRRGISLAESEVGTGKTHTDGRYSAGGRPGTVAPAFYWDIRFLYPHHALKFI